MKSPSYPRDSYIYFVNVIAMHYEREAYLIDIGLLQESILEEGIWAEGE